MANVSFTLTVNKPNPFAVGTQTITGNINIITIANPGPENINTAYTGTGYLSYLPGSISTLQFNNAGPPPIFVAATTAHGSATLTTTSTSPPRAQLNIGLYNFDASATKLFQIQDTSPPGAPAGTVLQSAQVSYAVLTSGAVGTSPTLVRPTLPTKVWLCWRANSNPILTTDPDVVTATIDTTNLVFSAQMNIDDSPATMYVSSDGVNWTAQTGSPWTASGIVTSTSIAITTPAQQASGAPFLVNGTLSGYSVAPTLQFSDDGGTFQSMPSGSTVTATGYSFTNPGLAAGSHTITVRDANATGTTITSGSFTVAAPSNPQLTVTTPGTQQTGSGFTVSGTIVGYSAAPTLNYRDDAGSYAALPGGATVTATSFSFTNPALAAGVHTVSVRDANNTANAVTTGNFTVAAPSSPVITINAPSSPVAGTPFTLSGTMTNEPSAPTLTYTDDSGSAQPLPAGAVVTTTSFSFTHPGLAAGAHTTLISDGTNSGSIGYSVQTSIPGGASPDKTVVTNTTGSITDNASNQYKLTAGGQVAINGLVGTAQTVTGLSAIIDITYTLSGSVYTYSVAMLDNGSLPVGTMWFAWQPGQNYLPSLPTPISPAGWTATVTGGPGGYGIEWVAATPIQPGQQVVFQFSSTDTPTTLFSAAASFPSVIVATATIYQGTPTSTSANTITVPSSIPQQTAGQTFFVQAAFSYVPNKANLQYSANSAGVVYGPFSGNTGITWDSTGQIATIPISSGTAAPHFFQVEDTSFTPSVTSVELTYQVGTSGGGGTYTATPTTGGQAVGVAVVASNNEPAVLIPTTANVVELAWVSGLVYYENTSGLWFSETSPNGPWTPPGGSLTSPLAATLTPTITLNAAPSSIAPNTPFTITGSLANYTSIPVLTFSDDGGPAQSIPSGSPVSTTSFSFTHAGEPTGNHSLLVSDGTTQASITYSVGTSAWTSLAPTSSLTETISGLSPNTTYQIEVYATNAEGEGPPSAILTVTTTGIVITAPNPPTGLSDSGVTQTAVNLFWLPPSSGPTPTSYGTRWSPTGANSWTNGPVVTVATAQITGLSAGTTYDFEVWSINTGGASAFSSIFTTATAAAPAQTVAWQPQGASATIALSNNNLTATAGGSATVGSSPQGVVATQSITNAKGSFEVTLTQVSDSVSIGLANSTFTIGNQLGSDNNSIGYFPCNIPAVTQSESVSGLPLWGVGVDLAYPGSNTTVPEQTWVWFTNNFCTPRTCLVYPGAFDTQGNITYYTQSYINGWKNNGGGYWNGTVAAQTGIPLKKCIPIAGVPLTTLDGTVTFATATAHQNTAYFNNFIDMWKAAGFTKIAIRLCWEDNYPTTPAGQDATPGSNFPATTSGNPSYTPWHFYGGGAAYMNAFILAWRAVAYDMHQHALAVGVDLTMVWGPTIINSQTVDWRTAYPDSVLSDGHGKQVDCLGPDFYFGNFWGDLNLRSNYNTQQPFTAGTITQTQLIDSAHISASQHTFGMDPGSMYYWADWTDGYKAPPATPTTPLGYNGGMSMYETFVFALQNQIPVMWCEFGGLDQFDGGTNAKGTTPNLGLSYTGAANWANEPSLAAYARTRIAWFQNKAQNGIANGTFLQFSFWQGQGQQMLNAFRSEFPELVTNPDAGASGVGAGGTVTTRAAIVPQTIRTGGASVLVPSGNSPAADVAGATISVCFDTSVTPALFWVTSPAMRATYGANAWNNSATANPGTGVGGISFTVSGPVTASFNTGESGGIAVLNAGSSPYVFSGIPTTFPPLHGQPPVITAPGQVTGLAVAQAGQSISMPPSIPNQTAGQAFSVQFAFNYKPNPATLYFTPYDTTGNITYNGITFSPFTDTPPTGGSITWDSTGTIATIKWILGATVSHPVQVIDVQSSTVTVASPSVNVLIVSTTGQGGGTYTATAQAPSTAVQLSWTAPSTGSTPFTYLIMQSPTGLGQYSIVGSSTTTSVSLAGLQPGIAYDYVVYASNGAGNGTQSSLVTYTIPGTPTQSAPLAVTGVSASNATTTSIAVAWQAATTGSPATGYQVQYKQASASTFISFSPTTVQQQQVITGLVAGTAYNFQVVAFNAVGNAPASSPVATASTLSSVTPPPPGNPLLTLLSGKSGVGSISGQYVGTGPITPISTIQSTDGQWLGLIGGDYWPPSGVGAPVLTFNQIAINYATAGGIIMLTLSMPNPTTGGPATDTSSLAASTLLTAGSPANTALVNTLSQVAIGLAQLKAAGVQVILRPFAHANSTDFWWGSGTTGLTAAQFVSLWQYVWNYFETTKGLTNLVWCYGAVTPFSTFSQATTRYPGSTFVDIVGLEIFTSIPVSVTPTDVITVNAIPNTVSGQTFSMSGTGTLAWTSAAAVSIAFNASQTFVPAQASGYTVTLSNNNMTATVTGITAPAAGTYTAFMKDTGYGVTSLGTQYTVTPAQQSGGGATSVAGLPYLGWGLELCYPNDGFTTGGIDDAALVMINQTAAFGKPTNMLMYGGSFANIASVNFALNGYLGTWNNSTYFNGTYLGYKLIPILGIPITTQDGGMTFATIAAGTNDAAIQNYLQICLNAGYKTIALRISWEDNLPTTPAGQSAGSSQWGAAAVTNGGAAWGHYGGESIQSFSSTIAGLPAGQAAFADAYIKAWRRFAWVVQQFAVANQMTVWKMWGPCVLQSGWFDPRLIYPDTASYMAADGWGKLVDVHAPDLYFGNPNVQDAVNMKHGYDALPASAPFNGLFATTGSAANKKAFFADIGSEYYMADFRSGGGTSQQTAYNANPNARLPWSGGWNIFESMVWALQNQCMWGVPEGYATEGDDYTSTSGAGKNTGTNLYGTTGFPPGKDFPNLPEVPAYLRKRITWFQNATFNKIYAGQVLFMAFWGSSAGIEMLQAFAAEFPEVSTTGANNPFAGQVGVAFPTPR